MAYFIRMSSNRAIPGGTLVERKHEPMPCNHFVYRRVSGEYAHRWVRQGDVHETALYIDGEGRIRKAQPGC